MAISSQFAPRAFQWAKTRVEYLLLAALLLAFGSSLGPAAGRTAFLANFSDPTSAQVTGEMSVVLSLVNGNGDGNGGDR
jgi:hypothetical protein